MGLQRGPLSLVSTIEELLERKSSGSGLERENTAVGIRRADHVADFYPQTLALTSHTSGGRSVGTVRLRTHATEFCSCFSAGFQNRFNFIYLIRILRCKPNTVERRL
jgi:hypothetical protein